MNVIQAKDISKSLVREKADVIVIGSGAGGAIMAYELAAAGKKVILLEAGPYVPSSEFNEVYADMIERLYVDAGGQTNTDGDINIVQGACLGGSTVNNATVALRIPDWVLKHWEADHGVEGMMPADLSPKIERVERRLSIHRNEPFEINRNSELLRKGCDKLGWSVQPTPRNVKDCVLVGYCVAGCRYDRKQSMLVTYVPWAIEKGARVYTDARVEEIRASGGRATGVGAVIRDPETKETIARLEVEARAVVLAAGAIQTPLLLLRSGIANRNDQVGRNFSCHPSVNIAALFDEPVDGWVGAMHGVYCDEFGPEEKGGFLFQGACGDPYLLNGFMVPGFGGEATEIAKQVRHMASMAQLTHDHSVGRVSWDDGVKKIEYRTAEEDKERMRTGIRAGARIWLAAGARKVILPSIVPSFLESEKDLGLIDAMPMDPGDLNMFSYHPQGTCRMGEDPERTVVNSRGQSHEIPNLVIADASVFPTSVLVNTQLPIYTLATHFADLMNAEPDLYFA
jgi:choline dehydrogenase-like flavoprotein